MDFCELPYRAHSLELSFESVEDLDPLTMDRLAIVGSHIYTDGSRIEAKKVKIDGQRLTFNLLAHAARQDIRDIVAEGSGYAIFRRVPTQIPRATHVLTSSPGTPPLKRRWQRIMIAFYAKRRSGRRKPGRVAAEIRREKHCTCIGSNEEFAITAYSCSRSKIYCAALEEYQFCMKECAETEVGTGHRNMSEAGFPEPLKR
ncbi:hypothetical protein EVAR_52489_1 [Eumeta japonica]|uniref:Uncharacterized protein n=1 Tax=Eumeta variegata TaxID=151549 RepID=A0A4C1ZHK0_EUMVA|nr:hypothetical protein EVAR_52489_1 [Eumeta japonica]